MCLRRISGWRVTDRLKGNKDFGRAIGCGGSGAVFRLAHGSRGALGGRGCVRVPIAQRFLWRGDDRGLGRRLCPWLPPKPPGRGPISVTDRTAFYAQLMTRAVWQMRSIAFWGMRFCGRRLLKMAARATKPILPRARLLKRP